MEKRIGHIIIQSPGGTASKNSNTYKVSLPSSWIKELGLTKDNRQIEMRFDGTAITITRALTIQEFITQKMSESHELLLLFYYDNNVLCSKIAADYTDQTLCIEDFTSDIFKTAFGNNKAPTWSDYQSFLESRCIPNARAGLREYLEAIEIDAYDPLEIIKKTNGRMAEDNQWLKIEVMK